MRPLNEDSFLDLPEVGLWAVADGMGGHDCGEVASRMVVEALGALPPPASGYAFVREASEALQRANRSLLAFAAERSADVVGSTVVTLLAFDGHYACLWAGDSRAYLRRRGELCQLTRDHSLVQELIDSGALSQAEARRSRRGHVITRAVGVEPTLDLEMRQGTLAESDTFLLCSDGLNAVLEDADIDEVLAGARGLADAADRLVDLSLARGAPDNVTVLLVGGNAAG